MLMVCVFDEKEGRCPYNFANYLTKITVVQNTFASKGTEKRTTKNVRKKCCAFYHPHKTCRATNQVVNGFKLG